MIQMNDNKKKAQAQAVEQAVAQLRAMNRWETLPCHPEEEYLILRVFGQDVRIAADYGVSIVGRNEPIRPADHILVLHYLLCPELPKSTGELISLRDLPGGQFYWQPYRSRTVEPLARHFNNDLARLRTQFDLFDWTPVALGDLAARFHAIGEISLTLVYYKGDEDFEPTAEILFDSCTRHVYGTEDAVVLATRLCRGLIGHDCAVCSGCGMCDTRAIHNHHT